MKRVHFFVLMGLLLFASCNDKEDDDQIPNSPPLADYTPLEIGNYWVYEWVRVDSMGNETPMGNLRDSIYISKDTIINGETYFKFEGKLMGYSGYKEYKRDSLDCLINREGDILFSSVNFTDILRIDTIATVTVVHFQMNHADSTISVPYGIFSTLDYEGTYYPLLPSYPYGILYGHNFYAENIGLIKSTTFYYSSPYNTLEQRLVDYGQLIEPKL